MYKKKRESEEDSLVVFQGNNVAFQFSVSFYNLFYAITHPLSWLNWSDKEALMKFIYYGGSQELFFVFVTLFLFILLAFLICLFGMSDADK